jgi:hypothetical protein
MKGATAACSNCGKPCHINTGNVTAVHMYLEYTCVFAESDQQRAFTAAIIVNADYCLHVQLEWNDTVSYQHVN